MKIKIYLTYTTIFFTLFFFSACQNNSRNSKQEGKANLEIEEYISLLEKDSLNTKLIITLGNYYSKHGNIEKLIEFATPIYSKASKQKDSAALIHCSALLANAYNINEKIDSLNKYLEILSGYDLKDYPSIRGLVDNIKGGYYLNYSIDYPRSLSHFISAYEQIKTYDYPDNKIIILNNIVEICYALEDPSGIFYAREALKLTDEEGVDKYSHSQANSALAKMLLLNNQTDSAIFYALKADNYLADNQNNYKTNTQFLLGDIYYQRNDFTTAQKYYQSALKISDSSIRRVHAKILLNYGHNMFRLKEFEKAIEIYKQGINASANIHEIETKRDLYISLFEAYYMLNIEEQATEYYSKYYILRDSIQKLKQNTQKFNSHTVFRHNEEFKNDILSENSKNTDFGLNNSSLFSSILIVLLIIVVTYLIIKQRIKSKKKEGQGNVENNIQKEKTNTETEIIPPSSEITPITRPNNETIIFRKLESLMQNDYLYRQNLSLEDVAKLLKTNRTYISSSINTCSGSNFSNYINSYRIKEAKEILLSKDNDKSIEDISSFLGFNNISSFYRAFKAEVGCSPKKYINIKT